MTISSTNSTISYAGDDSTTVFSIPFEFDTSADITVIKTSSTGDPVELTSGFSITGGGGSTGNLTLTTALATGETLVIFDDPVRQQSTDYIANDSFPAETHEAALDKLTRLSKRLYNLTEQSVRIRDGDLSSGAGTLLPTVANRKGKYLRFSDTDGDVEVADITASTTVLSQSVIAGFLNPQTSSELSAGVTPTNLQYLPGDVRRYGATGLGVADDSGAIQNALDGVANGGSVYIPAGTYLIASELTVSDKTVHITGDGLGQSRLLAGAAMDSILTLDSTNSALGHFSSIENIYFDGNVRGFAIAQGALYVAWCDKLYVNNCFFFEVLGSGIKTERLIKGKITNFEIGKCGNTGKPAFDVNYNSGITSGFMQGTQVSNANLEVNHLAAYLSINANVPLNQWSKIRFESDSANAEWAQQFIVGACDEQQMSDIVADNNYSTSAAIEFTGSRNHLRGVMGTGRQNGVTLLLGGSLNEVSNLDVKANTPQSFFALEISGDLNSVDGFAVYRAAGVHFTSTASQNKVTDANMNQCQGRAIYDEGDDNTCSDFSMHTHQGTDEVVLATGEGPVLDYIRIRNAASVTRGISVTGSNYQIKNCYLDNINATTAAEGMYVSGNGGVIDGNHLRNIGGNAIEMDGGEPESVSNNTAIDYGDEGTASTYYGIAFISTTNKTVGGVCNNNRLYAPNTSAAVAASIFVTDNAGSPRYDYWTFVGNNYRNGGSLSVSTGNNIIANNRA